MEKKTPITSFFCYPMKMIPGSPFKQATATKTLNLLEESTIFPPPKRALWCWRCQQILRAGEGDETAEVEAADFTCRDWTDDNIACRSGLPTLGLTWWHEGIGVREKLRAVGTGTWKWWGFRCFQKVYLFLPSWMDNCQLFFHVHSLFFFRLIMDFRYWPLICFFFALSDLLSAFGLLGKPSFWTWRIYHDMILCKMKNQTAFSKRCVQPWWFLSNVGNDHRCQEKEATNGLP